MSKVTEDQDRNNIEKTMQTIDPGKNQIVYMMPQQDFEEDEIDLRQLFLPLLKYKTQIALCTLLGLLIIIGVSYLAGVTSFSSSLIYQYQDVSNPRNIKPFKGLKDVPDSVFLPDRDFLSVREISRAKSIFEKYFELPATDNIEIFYDYIIESGILKFEKCDHCNNTLGTRFSISTDDPQKTLKVLQEFNTYFRRRAREILVLVNSSMIEELENNREILYTSLFTAIGDLRGKKYIKIDATEYYSVVELGKGLQNKITRIDTQQKTQTDAVQASGLGGEIKSMVSLVEAPTSELGDTLQEIFQQLKSVDEKQAKLEIDRQIYYNQIFLNRQNMQMAETKEKQQLLVEQNQDLKEKVQAMAGDIRSLYKEQRGFEKLKNEKMDLLAKAIFIKLASKKMPSAVWDALQIQEKEEKIAGELVVEIRDYENKIKNINSEIIRLRTAVHFVENDLVSPLKLIIQPTLETIKKRFRLDFSMKKAPAEELKKDGKQLIVKPILYSKKIVLISVMISFLIGVLSVFIRVLIKKWKSDESIRENNQEFLDALKAWKL